MEIRQQLVSSIFDQSQEGIMITDARGTIIDVNDAFVRITGYSREEAIGHDPRFLQSGSQDKTFYQQMWDSIKETGYWKGEIWNRKKSGQLFPELLSISAIHNEDGEIAHYVGIFLDISEIKDKENELRRLAHFDTLTGLPNRTLAMDRLRQGMSRLQRNGQLLAVAYVDLDGFKEINDAVGHHGGDRLLIEMANRMKNVLRGGDSIARLGGDEFMAMLTDLHSPDDVEAFISRFYKSIRQPIDLDGKTYKISASVGITFYPQKQEVDAEILLRQADQAMYQSKLAGKDQHYIYDADIDSYSRGRHALIQQVRDGLRNHEFTLHFQPKVNMRSGAVIGLESLIRWHHPELGLLEPSAFLPKLVGHETEIEVGWWCIDTALAQMNDWLQNGQLLPISVNVSASQIQQPHFIDALRTRLSQYPLIPANSLELEILETSALGDLHYIGLLIEECAKIGIQFSVDDFGTGYSTLLMLRHLPAQFLKIDRSFVQNLLTESDDLVLMESMIALGRAFGRQIIAEGVETELQAELLLRLGCELGQGYGIARPMPASELSKWLNAWQVPDRWRVARQLQASEFKLLELVVQHSIWALNVEKFCTGNLTSPPELNSLACDLSHGLKKIGLQDTSHPLVVDLLLIHEKLHGLAESLCTDVRTQKNPQVMLALPELKKLSSRLLQTWFDLADTGIASPASA